MSGAPDIFASSKSAEELDWGARLLAGTDPWRTLRRDYSACRAILADPLREVFIARADGRPAGLVALVMAGALRGYIQAVAVEAPLRGRGLGAQLVAFAERRVFSEVPNVFMCVSSFNAGARRLYARLGYETIGEIKDYVVAGHSEFLIRKTRGPLEGYSPERA